MIHGRLSTHCESPLNDANNNNVSSESDLNDKQTSLLLSPKNTINDNIENEPMAISLPHDSDTEMNEGNNDLSNVMDKNESSGNKHDCIDTFEEDFLLINYNGNQHYFEGDKFLKIITLFLYFITLVCSFSCVEANKFDLFENDNNPILSESVNFESNDNNNAILSESVNDNRLNKRKTRKRKRNETSSSLSKSCKRKSKCKHKHKDKSQSSKIKSKCKHKHKDKSQSCKTKFKNKDRDKSEPKRKKRKLVSDKGTRKRDISPSPYTKFFNLANKSPSVEIIESEQNSNHYPYYNNSYDYFNDYSTCNGKCCTGYRRTHREWKNNAKWYNNTKQYNNAKWYNNKNDVNGEYYYRQPSNDNNCSHRTEKSSWNHNHNHNHNHKSGLSKNNNKNYDKRYNPVITNIVDDDSLRSNNINTNTSSNSDKYSLPTTSPKRTTRRRRRRKRPLLREVSEYVEKKDKGNNNIFNSYLAGDFKQEIPNFGSFNVSNLDKQNKHIAVIYIEEYFLNEIFNGKKTLEIRKYNIIKWANKWIGVTCKSGEIHGQILISQAKLYENRDDLITRSMTRKHRIQTTDDQKRFIGDKSYAWNIAGYTKYPSPLKYDTKWGIRKYHNVEPHKLTLAVPSNVYANSNKNNNNNQQSDCFSTYHSSSLSPLPSPSPSPSLTPLLSSSKQLNLPPIEHRFKSQPIWKQSSSPPIPPVIQGYNKRLSDRAQHRQILDYEELDSLIFNLWLFHDEIIDTAENFDCIYYLLYTTIECIHLVPKTKDAFNVNKFEWIPPNLSPSEFFQNDYVAVDSLKSIIEKWINDTPKLKKQLVTDIEQNNFNQLIERLEHEYNRHVNICEYFGPTIPYTTEKKDRTWDREKCPGCWRQFRYDACRSPIRCTVCAEVENCHCTNCIIAAGKNGNVPVCPKCASTYYIVKSLDVNAVALLKDLKIAQILETTENVLIQFTQEETDTLLYCKSVLVNDRFAEFTREELILALGEETYDKLVQKYLNRPKNVVFEEYEIDLKQGLIDYIEARGDDQFYGESIRNHCNWSFNTNKFKIKVSSIGPLKYDGHVIAPAISTVIEDKGEYEKKAIEEYDNIFNDADECIADNEIATKFCHATLFKPGEVGILGLEEAYKGKGNCWKGLTHSKELQEKMINSTTNKLNANDGYYWTDKELQNVTNINWNELDKKKQREKNRYKLSNLNKEPRLQVVESDKVKEYLKENHENLVSSMHQYELLSNILSYTVATQIPQLKPVFYQHIAYDNSLQCRYTHGSWYGNKDFIKYWPRSRVHAHVDHQDLVQPGDYHFGPYVVIKLGKTGSDQMLCSVSNKSSYCEFDRSKPRGDRDHGGHVKLPPGTIYWMFDEGAMGGISHSIHNAENQHELWSSELFGGFKSKSYTLVMRPFLINSGNTIFDIRKRSDNNNKNKK